MLRPVSFVLFILLAGCADEADFDSRFDDAEQAIEQRAEAIDAELTRRPKEQAGPPKADDASSKE